jgi:ribonuclease VapC
MNTAVRGWVLDASALLAMLQAEPGAEAVEAAVEHSVMSSVNWSEVYQRALTRGIATAGLRADVEAVGLRIVPLTADDAEQAAELWRLTRHLGLSLGDRACLALARRLGRRALTADRSWTEAELGVEVQSIR